MQFFQKRKKKNQKGFTLVELLVVIAIIGILAAIITPNIFAQIEKSRASAVVSEYRAAKTAALLVTSENPAADITFDVESNGNVTGENADDYAAFMAMLEKPLGTAPFGGYYSIIGPSGADSLDTGDGTFLLVPQVPEKAFDTLENTFSDDDVVESGTVGSGFPKEIYLRLLPNDPPTP
ncbi:prepilin-type N-terminal cleavage/methylation domain-containing protein [Desulfuribacillus alkaliarsenatis]|uniref:Prepilin-type N-terminal cleavage/methylation domain-containing protein n=1 Tax=Desulfuribacillus alkaliarsenatis TaxID=766136 RepID=A0A1E5G571_9FIRM|nr:prepilin-type N-terminal cleavage/methylation domain-containing protein [Desulfuribacillus alkaliarsenatis]OEF98330.1 hypothetical protein BHF68_01225 [Desulfuribacillus alkaliarsenatis]